MSSPSSELVLLTRRLAAARLHEHRGGRRGLHQTTISAAAPE